MERMPMRKRTNRQVKTVQHVAGRFKRGEVHGRHVGRQECHGGLNMRGLLETLIVYRGKLRKSN